MDKKQKHISAIIAASSGNLVEWFDFYIYAFCAIYFAPHFFPKEDQTAQLLYTAGIFAAGFLMRPIGSWFLGRVADKHGRKKSLVISVLLMALGSLIIACLPGYETIGIAASFFLLLARLMQGFSVGGEYGTVAAYLSEMAITGQRGFYASFQYVTLIGGQLLAVFILAILQLLLNETELRAWGWRIPFVLGAMTSLLVFWLRKDLKETTSSVARSHQDAGNLLAILKKYPNEFVTIMGYTAAGSLAFYTFTTYMQKYLVNTVHVSIQIASYIMLLALIVFMFAQPFFGILSDKIGRKNNMLLFSGLGIFMVIPIFSLLPMVTHIWAMCCLIIFALLVLSFYTSIAGLIKAEVFPPEVRVTGLGVAYALANAVFGGTAEWVGFSFKIAGHENLFYWYVTGILILGFFFCLRLPKVPKYL